MKKEYNTPDDFYREAMQGILKRVGEKLQLLGVDARTLPELIELGDLSRYTSDAVDGIVLERYDYKGIMLEEFEWTSNGIKQRDIQKDETDFNRNI